MKALTWWLLMIRRVLAVSGVLAIGASLVFNLQAVHKTFVAQDSGSFSSWDRPKPMAKTLRVTSRGTWRSMNRTINLQWVTDPKNTNVEVIDPKPLYHVGDTLRLAVVARDGKNRRKVYGGDFLRAVLRDEAQKASTTGKVKDHLDGSYTVSFLLSFAGTLTAEVQLIHPSETVQLLRELREVPKREWSCAFKSHYGREVTEVCTFLPNQLYPLSSQCNFSAPNTSRTWFCKHPKTTACDSIKWCKSSRDTVDKLVNSEEQQLFESPFWKTSLTADMNATIVVSDVNKLATASLPRHKPSCKPGMQHPAHEGFWLNDIWRSLSCRVTEFKPQDMTKCLANKVLHFRGDSTCRQWLQRLVELNVVEYAKKENVIFGPFTTINRRAGIRATFDFHSVPVQSSQSCPFRRLNDTGIAAEMDQMIGGPNVVLVLSLCAHFTAEPRHVYISRMFELKSAILKFQEKYPETKVLVKMCNTRRHRHYRDLVQASDWLADQLNQEMRGILGDLNVAILDVWDMTISQWYPMDVHPRRHVVDNELNILMSYICPEAINHID